CFCFFMQSFSCSAIPFFSFFFFTTTATSFIYTLSLHDALPICPDLLDRRGRVVRVPLFELVPGLVVVLAALELLDRLHDRVVIARERQRGHGRQRVHHRDHVLRTELVLDEIGERLADDEVVAAADVV